MKDRYMNWDGEMVRMKEAKKSLAILVNEQNIKNAVRGDETACAISQAICAIIGHQAKVFRNVAYVKKDGKAFRYIISGASRRQIIHFDVTGEFPSGPVILQAPSPSQLLDSVKTRTHARRSKKADSKRPLRRTTHKSVKMDGVRLGSGKITFA